MRALKNKFAVSFEYPIYFTEGLFQHDNPLLKEALHAGGDACGRKIFFVIDHEVYKHHPSLLKDIRTYFSRQKDLMLCNEILMVPGGELVKNDISNVDKVINAIERNGLCRHSFLVAIGGGAVLDMTGYASAIAHRGIRHIRIPTTVLSQNDSGIGVKNGVNAFGKKNFIGTFCPPYAVINDLKFLYTLNDRDWRSGISEAIKVALIKDPAFFEFIEKNADAFAKRDMNVMAELIHRCAELHMNHIGGADPFEKGSSRPLDFGHWAAHKLEQMSSYSLKHGEAVAIGIALDSTISMLTGRLKEEDLERILTVIRQLGFNTYVPELSMGLTESKSHSILKGLTEFREHLGGNLAIMLLEGIGKGVEVSSMDEDIVIEAVYILKQDSEKKLSA